MARGKEKDYLGILKNTLLELGCYAYKIPDTPFSTNFRFSTKKPFDMVACHKGDFIAIEGKFTTGLKAFGHKEVSEHQHDALELVDQCFGESYVFYFVDMGVRKEKRLYIFPYQTLKSFRFYKKDLEKLSYMVVKQKDKKKRVLNLKEGFLEKRKGKDKARFWI